MQCELRAGVECVYKPDEQVVAIVSVAHLELYGGAMECLGVAATIYARYARHYYDIAAT